MQINTILSLFHEDFFGLFIYLFWFGGHTHHCLGLAPGSAQESVLEKLEDLNGVLEKELGSAECKESFLPSALSFWPFTWIF